MRLSFATIMCAFVMLAALPALADRPAQQKGIGQPFTSTGELTPTPEMWFYQQQMEMYLDPKMAVRRAAEFRAQQRANRLAAMKWFGLSNSRPRASVDPIHWDYSPGWTSNNPAYPYRWAGQGWPYYVLYLNGANGR
jgi:hypothetical protein